MPKRVDHAAEPAARVPLQAAEDTAPIGVRTALQHFLRVAQELSTDVEDEVEEVIQTGWTSALDEQTATRLLRRVVEVLRAGAKSRRDRALVAALEGDIDAVVARLVAARRSALSTQTEEAVAVRPILTVTVSDGEDGTPIRPTPVFHTRPVPMVRRRIRLRDLELWAGNERLEIHVQQFRHINGRDPSSDELIKIMQSALGLVGIPDDTRKDEFEIENLARSIAVNGLRKPPIIDTDGTLLDGNRRVAACYYILAAPASGPRGFTTEQKKRIEKIDVWQLTPHATEDDRTAVIVSLNFEPDYKLDWPEYVKARKVYDDYMTVVTLEGPPLKERARDIKRELSRKYAIEIATVDRYIRMVLLAEEFEEYHVNVIEREVPTVKHHANRYFQYFDELSKGTATGSVAVTLQQDDDYRALVFDLLFEGKFKNWALVRHLKHVDEDVVTGLEAARQNPDRKSAQRQVEETLTAAMVRHTQTKSIAVEPRIREFVKFIRKVPLEAFHDGTISGENLDALIATLEWVKRQVAPDRPRGNRSRATTAKSAGARKRSTSDR